MLTYYGVPMGFESTPPAVYYVPGWGWVQRRVVDALTCVKREVEAWARENKATEYTITVGIQTLGLQGSVSVTFKPT